MARQCNMAERIGKEAVKFAFYHQREVLAGEMGLMSITEATGVAPERTQFYNPSNREDILYNFMVESMMEEEAIKACI